MKQWKQPTPTDIRYNQSIDTLSRLLFFEILNLCQNEDYLFHFIHNDKHYSVPLKRGECIFQISKIAKELKVGRKRVKKSIETLSKWYSEMDSKEKPYGLILSLKNYDELTKMDSKENSRGTAEGQQRDSKGTPNKSDKSDKNEKKETPTSSDVCLSILEEFNQLTGKKLKMTDGKRTQIKGRLKVFTREDVSRAIRNRLSDPSSMGDNPTGTIWAYDWDSLFRNDQNFERALNKEVKINHEKEMEKVFEELKARHGDPFYAEGQFILKYGQTEYNKLTNKL